MGDGRNFLTQRRDRFDVIISQPSNPWITGVSNLFTREYFRDVRARLADDGVFCQWAQLYEMSPFNIKTIYRTLRDEFPHVLVFAAEDLSSDTILIASARPHRPGHRPHRRACWPTPAPGPRPPGRASTPPTTSPPTCCWAPRRSRPSPPGRW